MILYLRGYYGSDPVETPYIMLELTRLNSLATSPPDDLLSSHLLGRTSIQARSHIIGRYDAPLPRHREY